MKKQVAVQLSAIGGVLTLQICDSSGHKDYEFVATQKKPVGVIITLNDGEKYDVLWHVQHEKDAAYDVFLDVIDPKVRDIAFEKKYVAGGSKVDLGAEELSL